MDPSAKKTGQTFRILLIEDDPANRLFFSEYLDYCGFDVHTLPHGLDLECQLKTVQPHLLVLDIGLPVINGYTLLEYIRSSKQWKDLPVVIISGYAFDGDKNKAFALGVQKYLVKPVRLRELAATIKSLLM